MATEIVEMGKISTRGQIAIPSEIRREMDLKEGSRVLFALIGDSLIIRKMNTETFKEITKPFKEAARKAGMKEKEVDKIIHDMRKNK
jgi:AbrB family looped-hinge helix DNA binding protein